MQKKTLEIQKITAAPQKKIQFSVLHSTSLNSLRKVRAASDAPRKRFSSKRIPFPL